MLKQSSHDSSGKYVTTAAVSNRQIQFDPNLDNFQKNDGSDSIDSGSQRYKINYLSSRPAKQSKSFLNRLALPPQVDGKSMKIKTIDAVVMDSLAAAHAKVSSPNGNFSVLQK